MEILSFFLFHRITPATPTSVVPPKHHHHQSPKHLPRSSPLTLRHPSGKNWDAILEDISSDSSDGMDTPERCVWEGGREGEYVCVTH